MATDFFKIGKAAGQQFVDVSGAVQRGLEMGLKPFAEYEKSRKERVDALGRILQKTPNLAELPKIPEQYSPKISEWAVNAKNEYAAAARTIVQTSADSPEYQEAVQKINSITNAFVNLDDQLKGIREERIEYLDDYQNDRISAGYINGYLEQAYGLNGAITEIDASGNISLTGANNKSFKWNERQEHFVKSGNVAKQWNGIGEDASKIGLSGQEKDMSFFIEKARLAIGTYDLPMLKSLVFDDLDGTDVRLDQNIEGIDNPNEVFDILTSPPDREKIQRLKDILAQKTGRALFDVYQKSKSQYDKALRASDPVNKLNDQRAQGKKRFKDTLVDINTAFDRKNKEYFVNKKIDNKPIESVRFTRDENNNPVAVFDVVVSTAGGKLTTKEITLPYKRGEVIKDLTTTFVKNQFGSDAITDYGLSQYDEIVNEIQTARAARKIRNTDFAK